MELIYYLDMQSAAWFGEGKKVFLPWLCRVCFDFMAVAKVFGEYLRKDEPEHKSGQLVTSYTSHFLSS
jgi:hypothetical protein